MECIRLVERSNKKWGEKRSGWQEERYQQKCCKAGGSITARAGIGDTSTKVPSASLFDEKTAKYCSVSI